MASNSETVLVCPRDNRWRLVMDPAQVFPDDPGNGTPLLLEGPGNLSGTYDCAIQTGECDGQPVPSLVYHWLDSEDVTNAIVEFWNSVEKAAA